MNEQEIMNNYLLLLKSSVEVYVHGTLESSNEEIRSLLKSCLDSTMKHQANTYDEMVECNWYKVKNVKSSEVLKVLNKLKQ